MYGIELEIKCKIHLVCAMRKLLFLWKLSRVGLKVPIVMRPMCNRPTSSSAWMTEPSFAVCIYTASNLHIANINILHCDLAP